MLARRKLTVHKSTEDTHSFVPKKTIRTHYCGYIFRHCHQDDLIELHHGTHRASRRDRAMHLNHNANPACRLSEKTERKPNANQTRANPHIPAQHACIESMLVDRCRTILAGHFRRLIHQAATLPFSLHSELYQFGEWLSWFTFNFFQCTSGKTFSKWLAESLKKKKSSPHFGKFQCCPSLYLCAN